MIAGPNHKSARVPFRVKSNFHLRPEDIVPRRRKEEHGRRVVNRAVKWINEPVRFLAGENGEFGSMLDVPSRRYISPSKTGRYPINGGVFSGNRVEKGKKQHQTENSYLKQTNGKPPVCRPVGVSRSAERCPYGQRALVQAEIVRIAMIRLQTFRPLQRSKEECHRMNQDPQPGYSDDSCSNQ